MYDGARVPSPQDSVNGVPPAAVTLAGTDAVSGGSASVPTPAVQPKPEEEEGPEVEEEEPRPEPVLVKKAHREILDHERKRRVELKCMELQEMMEEQGYSEEEIRQKVGTFRQMLMEKEGVITREGAHTRPPVKHMVHGEHGEEQTDPALAEGYQEDGDWHGDYYDKDGYRMKRKSSSSPSPRPKKRKKKKSGRRRSRFDSSSPSRREKKKKSGKKHKRDRSTSGSRRKRKYRSVSPKNKQKDKNKTRKRSPVESPSRRSQRRGSCCSSRSASHSSTGHSPSKSPSRPNSKHKTDGHKACVSPSPSPGPGGPDGPVTWHNGHHHQDHARNGKAGRLNHNHVAEGDKGQDEGMPLY